MNVQPRAAPGCGFVISWIVLNVVGALLGLLLGGIAAFILSGAVIGGAQWLVLRRQIAMPVKWVWATALAWPVAYGAAGLGVVVLVVAYLGEGITFGVILFSVFAFGCAGAILGAAQWLILRKRVRRAGFWILINAAAWVLGPLGAFASDFVEILGLRSYISDPNYSFLLLPLLLGAVITGLGLTWPLRSPMPSSQTA